MHDRFFAAPRPTLELYDLAADPVQTKNLATDVAHAEDVRALEELLGRWMRAVNDYLPPPPKPQFGRNGEAGGDRAP
jgi:hypothetical protein